MVIDGMRAVPIPGQILRTTVFLGLTFDELVMLGSVPLVLIFPTLFVQQIPLVVTFAIAGAAVVAMGAIVVQSPEGQTPLEWAPAALRNRVKPDTYHLKPRTRNRDEIAIANVVHTAEAIEQESAEFGHEAGEDVDSAPSIGPHRLVRADPQSDDRAPEASSGAHANSDSRTQ